MRKKNQKFSLNTFWRKDKIRLYFPKLALLRSSMLCSRRSISALCNQYYLDQVCGTGTKNTAELETKVWTLSTFFQTECGSIRAAPEPPHPSGMCPLFEVQWRVDLWYSCNSQRTEKSMNHLEYFWRRPSPLKTLTAVLTVESLTSHFMCSGVWKRQTSQVAVEAPQDLVE